MKRPLGVVLIAVSCLGFAAFALIDGSREIMRDLRLGHSPVGVIVGVAVGLGVSSLLAVGLWMMKGWARILALLASVPGFLISASYTGSLLLSSRRLRMDFAAYVLLTLYLAWVSFYLFRPRIKEAFRAK